MGAHKGESLLCPFGKSTTVAELAAHRKGPGLVLGLDPSPSMHREMPCSKTKSPEAWSDDVTELQLPTQEGRGSGRQQPPHKGVLGRCRARSCSGHVESSMMAGYNNKLASASRTPQRCVSALSFPSLFSL